MEAGFRSNPQIHYVKPGDWLAQTLTRIKQEEVIEAWKWHNKGKHAVFILQDKPGAAYDYQAPAFRRFVEAAKLPVVWESPLFTNRNHGGTSNYLRLFVIHV
jgi:hypothetical protein